jgi:hypothetical protein
MTLDASGNLGVGTASPAVASGIGVVVNGGASAARFAMKNTATGNAAGDGFQLAVSDIDAYIEQRENGFMAFTTNNTERARITAGGSLLVNRTSALTGEKLASFSDNGENVAFDVRGNYANLTLFHGYTNGTTGTQVSFLNYNGIGVGSITSTSSATAYNTSSDRRLKENIVPADDAGSVIDSIQIVKHDWKVGGHTRYGVIAQDLNEVAPEAVAVGDDDDVEELKRPWGVDYSKLVPMLVKEIQSLRARVAALEGAE